MLDREKIEWSQHYWCDTDDNTLPRVLLIGDSIVAGHRFDVSDRLKGIATVAAFSSSKIVGDPGFYRELQLALADYPVDLICINNGLHGTPYTDEYYRERLKELVLFLRQNTRARLSWRNSTPITVKNEPEKFAELNEMVLHRNRIAEEIMKELHVPVLDLYTPMAEHPEYSAKDGYHYNAEGRSAQADIVAEFLKKILAARSLEVNINGFRTDFPGHVSDWYGYECLNSSSRTSRPIRKNAGSGAPVSSGRSRTPTGLCSTADGTSRTSTSPNFTAPRNPTDASTCSTTS